MGEMHGENQSELHCLLSLLALYIFSESVSYCTDAGGKKDGAKVGEQGRARPEDGRLAGTARAVPYPALPARAVP